MLKYEIAYNLLKKRIKTGQYEDGLCFPKEEELAVELKIARVTLRTALKHLENDGLIQRIPGKGPFVKYSKNDQFEVKNWKDEIAGKRLLCVFGDSDKESSTVGIINGAEARCRELGIDLDRLDFRLLSSSCYDDCLHQLQGKNYTGVILAAAHFNGDELVLKFLKELDVPVVMPFGHDYDRISTPFALFDVSVRQATFTALKHLLDLGHRNIAFIGPYGAEFINGVTPLEYRTHTDMSAPLFFKARCVREDVSHAVDEMLALKPQPTAILCIDSFYAVLALDALAGRGIKVPEEISVIGYGDMPGCELLNPPLTYVSPCLQERGESAVDYLLGAYYTVPFVGVKLHVNGSTGICKK